MSIHFHNIIPKPFDIGSIWGQDKKIGMSTIWVHSWHPNHLVLYWMKPSIMYGKMEISLFPMGPLGHCRCNKNVIMLANCYDYTFIKGYVSIISWPNESQATSLCLRYGNSSFLLTCISEGSRTQRTFSSILYIWWLQAYITGVWET